MRNILYISTNHFVLLCFDTVGWASEPVTIIPQMQQHHLWLHRQRISFFLAELIVVMNVFCSVEKCSSEQSVDDDLCSSLSLLVRAHDQLGRFVLLFHSYTQTIHPAAFNCTCCGILYDVFVALKRGICNHSRVLWLMCTLFHVNCNLFFGHWLYFLSTLPISMHVVVTASSRGQPA